MPNHLGDDIALKHASRSVSEHSITIVTNTAHRMASTSDTLLFSVLESLYSSTRLQPFLRNGCGTHR
jgi:hypothetical protein